MRTQNNKEQTAWSVDEAHGKTQMTQFGLKF